MNRLNKLAGSSLMIAVLLLGVAACAGTKESPIDEEKQAFADFRAEMESAIADPERAAQAVALTNELEQNLKSQHKPKRHWMLLQIFTTTHLSIVKHLWVRLPLIKQGIHYQKKLLTSVRNLTLFCLVKIW